MLIPDKFHSIFGFINIWKPSHKYIILHYLSVWNVGWFSYHVGCIVPGKHHPRPRPVPNPPACTNNMDWPTTHSSWRQPMSRVWGMCPVCIYVPHHWHPQTPPKQDKMNTRAPQQMGNGHNTLQPWWHWQAPGQDDAKGEDWQWGRQWGSWMTPGGGTTASQDAR